jgi:hypothetical protein
MKQIKLKVGKTYRSRDGEEVRIVWRDGYGSNYPYQGDNLEWYTKSGKWSCGSKEHQEDLIEEVTMSDEVQEHNEMEKIKLEVGKTYLSREGKEVRIVGKNHEGGHTYKGDDGNWYTESGGWQYYDKHPEDLIEELPETQHTFALVDEALTATRYTFTIPEGVKKITASQVGNRIVVEMVPEKEPKPGDVMINKDRSVYIFKGVVDDYTHKHYAWLGTSGRLAINTNTTCNPGRPATPEEAQPLWDALKKAGKRWNPETMQVEDITESDRIREWVEEHLDDGDYNQQGIAEVIEAYLKHKEGEK